MWTTNGKKSRYGIKKLKIMWPKGRLTEKGILLLVESFEKCISHPHAVL
jgi:hypothetical protein